LENILATNICSSAFLCLAVVEVDLSQMVGEGDREGDFFSG